MKPAAQPSRRPAKITGLADGRMILTITCRREPRKECPISSSEAGVWRTALERIQHDHRHRHDADGQHLGGEADAIGEDEHRDQRRERRRLRDDEERRDQPFGEAVRAPSARRAPTPSNDRDDEPDAPAASSVMSEGLRQRAVERSSRQSAAMVSRKVGKAGLIGMRPAYSHAPQTITDEMSRSRQRVRQAAPPRPRIGMAPTAARRVAW